MTDSINKKRRHYLDSHGAGVLVERGEKNSVSHAELPDQHP